MNMRRSLLIGAAAAVVGLVSAGLALASAHSGATTTIKFVATTTGQHFSTKTTFEESGKDTANGKPIGYYTLSCHLSSATAGKCAGAGSFSRGLIYFEFPLSTTSKTFSGRITGGTGAYKGATGKLAGKAISSKKTAVTITIT